MDNKADVGKRITELRKIRGYTREKLSEYSDVSVQFLADIEKGKKTMTIPTLRKISNALGVSTDYIVNGSEQPEDTAAITAMINGLSEEERKQAVKLLSVFIDT